MECTDFEDLINSIRQERVTLFIGSGFSKKAGAPMSDVIASALRKDLPPDISDSLNGQNLDIISEEYEEMHGRDALINKMEEILFFQVTDLSDHKSLTRIPHIHHIITTNYDTLLEDAYGDGCCYVVRDINDCINLPKDKTIIYKIHGDFKSKEHIILTKQDYTNFFSKNSNPLLWTYIQAHILTNDVLFIGYSLEDSNIWSIIQNIQDNIKCDSRKYFLIAPNFKKHKIDRLHNKGVKYYNAKAEELFPILFDTLNKNIKSDYQNKSVCTETFSRYCRLHNINPVIKEEATQNKIIRFDTGEHTEIKIKFDGLSDDMAKAILCQDSTRYNSYVPHTHIPALKFTPDILRDVSISFNDIKVCDRTDFKFFLLTPAIEDIQTSIRIPSRHFKEFVTLKKYNTDKETICLYLETDGYILKISFSVNAQNIVKCKCNVTTHDHIKNIRQANKWMDLIIALWSGEKVIIKKFDIFPLQFPNNDNNKLQQFKLLKKYYDNIIKIEELYDVDFDTIYGYSAESFRVSELLIHSYYEHILREEISNNEYVFNIDKDVDLADKIHVGGETYGFAFSQESEGSVAFNGESFPLKRHNTIIPSCIVESIENMNNSKSQIKIRITSEYVLTVYTNRNLLDLEEFCQIKKI